MNEITVIKLDSVNKIAVVIKEMKKSTQEKNRLTRAMNNKDSLTGSCVKYKEELFDARREPLKSTTSEKGLDVSPRAQNV